MPRRPQRPSPSPEPGRGVSDHPQPPCRYPHVLFQPSVGPSRKFMEFSQVRFLCDLRASAFQNSRSNAMQESANVCSDVRMKNRRHPRMAWQSHGSTIRLAFCDSSVGLPRHPWVRNRRSTPLEHVGLTCAVDLASSEENPSDKILPVLLRLLASHHRPLAVQNLLLPSHSFTANTVQYFHKSRLLLELG
jgi:hypothetical protein